MDEPRDGIDSLNKFRGGGGPEPRTNRMFDGNDVDVGVAGRTLTEW
jgi:hypothetical protein